MERSSSDPGIPTLFPSNEAQLASIPAFLRPIPTGRSNQGTQMQASDPFFQLLSEAIIPGNPLQQSYLSDIISPRTPETIRGRVDVLSIGWSKLLEYVPRRIISLKRQSNALLSINKLPVEILNEILWNAMLPIWFWTHYNNLYRLMQVCTWWAEIIKTTPRFWNFVRTVGTYAPEHIDLVLARSGPLISLKSLDMFLVRGVMFLWDADHATAKEHSQRWKSIQLVLEDYDEDETYGTRWSSIHSPNLDDISFTSPWPFTPIDLTRILQGRVLRARHLRINNTAFTCPENALVNLTAFTISGYRERQGHTETLRSNQLRLALQASPRLRLLTLFDVDLSCCGKLPKVKPAALPELEQLIWVNGKGQDQEAFFSAIKIPSCFNISLHWTIVPHPQDKLYLPFGTSHWSREERSRPQGGFHQSLGRIVDQTIEASILMHHGTHHQSFRFTTIQRDRSPGLDVQVTLRAKSEFNAGEGLEWVADVFGDQLSRAVVSLKVAGLHSQLIDFNQVPKLPSIVNITLHGVAMDGPHPLFQLLSYRTVGAKSEKSPWPLPELRTFTMRSSRSIIPLQLLSLIRNRYSASQTQISEFFSGADKISRTTPPPARLTSINIRYRASERIVMAFDAVASSQICRLVGPGVFNQYLCPDDDRYSLRLTGDIDCSKFALDECDAWDEIPDKDGDTMGELGGNDA